MPETLDHAPSAALSTLPGAAVIRRIRRLLIWAIGAGVVYGTFGTASRGSCPGGFTGDGGFIDANGDATAVAPQCVQLNLRPSGIVFVVIAVIVIWAITRVLRQATDEAAAMRILDRAVIVIVTGVAAWMVLTLVSFLSIPLDQWDGSAPFWFDFTLGVVEVDQSPMQR